MDDNDRTRTAADALGADFETSNNRSAALHTAAWAMVGPASKPHEETQVLLCGALVRACRASEDPLTALANAGAALKNAWSNTRREYVEAADRDDLQ